MPLRKKSGSESQKDLEASPPRSQDAENGPDAPVHGAVTAVGGGEGGSSTEERLRLVLEASSTGSFEIDLCTGEGQWNDTEFELLGLSPGEVPPGPETFFRYVHPDDVAELKKAWDDAKQSGNFDVEFRVIRADGKVRWLAGKGGFLRLGRGREEAPGGARPATHFLGVNYDITARREAEEAARTNEKRLQLALDAAHLAAWDWNLSSGTLVWNTEHFRMLGYEPDSFAPTYRSWADRVHPDDLPATEALIQGAMARGEGYRAEFRLKLPDGTVKNVEAIGRFIKDAEGQAERLLGVISDITERKRLLKDLQKVNERLEQAVAERTAELLKSNKLLEQEIVERQQAEEERLALERQLFHAQKLESLGVLAGGIAHDFNNILTAIIGNAELALRRQGIEPPVYDNLRKIEQAATRAADLAQQMLAYSGKGRFAVQDLDVNRLLEDMLDMLELSISKKAELRLDLNRQLPQVEADVSQLRQVIMNLVINASEALCDKNGLIAIHTGSQTCAQQDFRQFFCGENLVAGRYVYLEVTDTGCGMDEEVVARVFDPFFTTKFTGRGLGLAAVLGIVKGHKGAVQVRSQPGQGTTVRVILPARGVQTGAAGEQAGPADAPRKGTVLLVDDEEAVRGIGLEMLRDLGYRPLSAGNGREAVAILQAAPEVELVILDLTMPVMDGEQCFRELRRLRPDLAIIVASGYSEQDVTPKFAGKGPVAFLQKPFRFATFQAAIRKALRPA